MRNKLILRNKVIYFMICIIVTLLMSGCGVIQKIKVDLGMVNKDFDYLSDNNINSVTVQSVRDKNFKFIIKDKDVTDDLYDILSKGKKVEVKSELKPDYIIQIQEKNGDVHEYSYIAGLDREENGNLFSDDDVYIVSKRLDEDLIRNFFNLRKPIDFYSVYYGSILSVVDQYIKEYSYEKGYIDIKDDSYIQKFIYSTDLRDFNQYINQNYKNLNIYNGDDCETVFKISTEGYDSDTFKMKVIVETPETKVNYYVICEYKDLGWNIKVSKDKAPEVF